jgi:tetratricopeptide (TPR) repeat protein
MQDTDTDLFGTLDALGDGSGSMADGPDADASPEATFEFGTGGPAAMSDGDGASMDLGSMEAPMDAADQPADTVSDPAPAPDDLMADPQTVPAPDTMPETGSEVPGDPGGFEDALTALADAFDAVVSTMPTGVAIGLVAACAVVIGIGLGVWVGRRRAPQPLRQDPVVGAASEPAAPAAAPPPSDTATLAPENPAFIAYQKILEDKGVPAKDQDIRLRDFAATLEQLRDMLDGLKPVDHSLRPSVDAAREALASGSFDTVVERMAHIGQSEAETGFDLRAHAEKQLDAAATARIVAGDLLFAQMAYADAAACYADALDALPLGDDARRAEYLNKLGTAAYQANDMDTAAGAFEQALAVLERHLGTEHADVATALNNLALLQYSRGHFDKAEPLYQRALAIDEAVLGDDHPGVATDLNNLALLYKKQNRLSEAEPLLKRALDIKEKTFDPGHPSLVTGLKNYASLLRALGRAEDAKAYEQRAGALPPKRRSDERAA